MEERRIWYQFVDEADGRDLEDEDIDLVRLTPWITTIDDLRDVIVSDTDYLLGIRIGGTPRWKLFKNREAYDDDNQGPLESRSLVENLCLDDVLIVEIPCIGELSLRDPPPLFTTDGAPWDFQNHIDFDDVAYALKEHFNGWQRGSFSRRVHPMFLCLGGPGTGKSRLLNEFPRIVQHEVFGEGEDEEMLEMLRDAYTFNITFDKETPLARDEWADPCAILGTRMMFQLQDSLPWDKFRHFRIPGDDVFEKVAELKGKSVRELCIFLCIDDLQSLHVDGNRRAPFDQAVKEYLAFSGQPRVDLPLVKLSRPTVDGIDVFGKFENTRLTQLLIDYMGGFGRALEVLYEVMNTSEGGFDFELIPGRVVRALLVAFPAITGRIAAMRAAFLAAICRQEIDWHSHFGDASIDDVTSAGLLRYCRWFFDCPYVLYLVLDTNENPWRELESYDPLQYRKDWELGQDWEELNCRFRVLRSMALSEQSSVAWTEVHRGAQFGYYTFIRVREASRTFEVCYTSAQSQSSGYDHGRCTADTPTKSVFVCCPARKWTRPDGCAYICLEDNDGDFFHEAHRYIRKRDELSAEAMERERQKYAGKCDHLVLYYAGEIAHDTDMRVPDRCAVVDRSCWDEYYGPFAAKMNFVVDNPLSSWDDSPITDC